MKCRGVLKKNVKVRGADCEVEVSGLDVGAARNSWEVLEEGRNMKKRGT